jgi:hypothetical protein
MRDLSESLDDLRELERIDKEESAVDAAEYRLEDR